MVSQYVKLGGNEMPVVGLDMLRVVVITALLAFFMFWVYWRAFHRGYEAGARAVLKQWKQTLQESEEEP
jgi:hypothetical protein